MPTLRNSPPWLGSEFLYPPAPGIEIISAPTLPYFLMWPQFVVVQAASVVAVCCLLVPSSTTLIPMLCLFAYCLPFPQIDSCFMLCCDGSFFEKEPSWHDTRFSFCDEGLLLITNTNKNSTYYHDSSTNDHVVLCIYIGGGQWRLGRRYE